MVIIVMLSSSKMRRKPVNIFMVNQSIIDLLASVFILLRQIFDHHYFTRIPSSVRFIYCQVFIVNLLHTLMFVSSGYNLVVLSIERYLAIMHPFSYDEEKVI